MQANKKPTTLFHQQQGAALISVLVILIVITILGITAMRMGLTGLTLATNSQISSLLFQAADKGMIDARLVPTPAVEAALDAAPIKRGQIDEVRYCVVPVGGANNVVLGVCDPTNTVQPNLSPRGISMTQVNIVRSPNFEITNSGENALIQGTAQGSGMDNDNILYSSTSVMPTVGSASPTEIRNCLALTSDDVVTTPTAATVTITDCLTDRGAVFTTHVEEMEMGYQ